MFKSKFCVDNHRVALVDGIISIMFDF